MEDHTSVELTPQDEPDTQNKMYQFLFYVCTEENEKTHLVNINANQAVTYYISKDTQKGFPSPSDCINDTTNYQTYCGLKEIKDLTLEGGLWKMYILFENGNDANIVMNQADF